MRQCRRPMVWDVRSFLERRRAGTWESSTGKVAIITGAGRLRGIGRACAVALAKLGCDVVPTGTGRAPESFPPDEQAAGWRDVESTAEQVREQGRRALPVVGDVTKAADIDRMVAETVAEFGRVDILINNAAFRRGEDRVTPDLLSEEVFRKVLDIKLVGSVLVLQGGRQASHRAGRGRAHRERVVGGRQAGRGGDGGLRGGELRAAGLHADVGPVARPLRDQLQRGVPGGDRHVAHGRAGLPEGRAVGSGWRPQSRCAARRATMRSRT